MEQNKKLQLEKIIKKLQGGDPVHGFPHIERVLKSFDLLKSDNKNLSTSILDALEWAVYLHDIGRVNKSSDHGGDSVFILDKNYKKEFPENVDMRKEICYAIANHQKFFDFEQKIKSKDRKNLKNLLLSLLILLDCTDTIGEAGINRAVRDTDIPLVPEYPKKEEKIERVKELLNDYTKRKEKNREIMKNSSILEHIIYNYAFTRQIRDYVKFYLSDSVNEEIEKRLGFSKKIGNCLLGLIT